MKVLINYKTKLSTGVNAKKQTQIHIIAIFHNPIQIWWSAATKSGADDQAGQLRG